MSALQLAFPKAEGYGRFATGGRGGKVLEVTNLNSGGEGSLRWACIQDFPRIIVFRVAGTISVDTQIAIYNPNITVAGQTAPGHGITIRNSPKNPDSPISIRTNNAIFCGLRMMPGIGASKIGGPRRGDAIDCFGNWSKPNTTYDIYLLNCTGLWSVDEIIDGYKARDYTIDSCLLAEPLNIATHSYTEKDPLVGHSKFVLFSEEGSRNLTLIRTGMALGIDRWPEIGLQAGFADVINNVMYGWGTSDHRMGGRKYLTLIRDTYGNQAVNIEGNVYRRGPQSTDRIHILYQHNDNSVGDRAVIFHRDNIDEDRGNVFPIQANPENSSMAISSSRVGDAAYTVVSAQHALQYVTSKMGAGASWRLDEYGSRVPREGPVEERIKQHILKRTGRIINSPDEVGGWPNTLAAAPYADTNKDGMPDAFSNAYPNATLEDYLWGGF